MKIKRFFASEMREALRQVKEELGADAVILSNNKVNGGIELVAAIDYDEDAIHRSLNNQTSPRETTLNSRQQASIVVKKQTVQKKKRSVFAKMRKTKVTNNLADAIEDDVINFSHNPTAAEKESHLAGQSQSANSFADLLQQSANKQSAKTTTAALTMHNERLQDAYSKPSLRDRKQPFISDFNDDEQSQLSAEEENAFNFETMARQEQAAGSGEVDDFFATQRTDSSSARRQTKTGKVENIQWLQDPALSSMQEEIKSLRGILENQLSGLAWGSFSRNHPHHAELLSRLYRLGIKSSLSEKIVKQLKTADDESLEDSWRRVLTIIAKNIPIMKKELLDEGGIVALVGPTGVGKTTNIAKLAARFTLKYGAKNLALVTTDSYRVGAHEQLKTYGRILGVPVYSANDEQELKQVLSRLDDKQLVLIDTAGMSHRDLRLAQQLSMLRHSHEKMKILAVISASSQTLAMDEVIKTFNARELDGCIASKVDESTSIGGIISILIENQLQLNYISDGQKVPEDIQRANTTDLLKQALEMVRQHPVSVNTDELAMSYSGGGLARAVG